MSETGFTTALFRRRLGQIWFGVMAFLFMTVIGSQLVGKTCQYLHQPAEVRLASCNLAWWIGLPRWAIEPENKAAGFWFHYGAAYADLGHLDIAQDYFGRFLKGVDLRPPVTLPDDLARADEGAAYLLHKAAGLPADSPARQVLEKMLAEGR